MPIESQQKFSSPEEEIAWLKQRLEEKIRAKEVDKEIIAGKEAPIIREAANEVVKEYAGRVPEKMLAPEYKMPEKEIGAKVLELKPEVHDNQMEELLGVLEEKGILNAVSVARRLGPHIEDDFHRVLIQYLLGKSADSGFSSKRAEVFKAVGMVFYEISFPREETKTVLQDGKTFKDFISGMEQFYSGMAAISEKKGFSLKPRIKPYFVLELALPNIGEEIIFYAAVSRKHGRLFEKQLLAIFPKAQIREKKDDYNIFNYKGESVGAVAQLKTSAVLPIHTYDKLNIDPLEVIANAFSKIDKEDEGAALQIIISPEAGGFSRRVKSALTAVKKGKSFKKALEGEASLGKEFLLALADFFGEPSSKKKEAEKESAKVLDEELVNLLTVKSSRPIMSANIRLLVSSKNKEEAEKHLNELKGAFAQFNEPGGNNIEFKDIEGKNLDKLFYKFSFRILDENEGLYLNTAELASIYHFPFGPLSAPKIKYLKAKDAPPPADLPREGLLIGRNTYRDEESLIYMTPDDRRRHLYLIGQTGTGKTVLMKSMAIQDIKAGKGVCVIDPHGEMVKELLGHIPQERAEDVIYFDPGDTGRPMGLNMLEYDPAFPEQKTFLINELLEIFNKLYNMSIAGGPMFEQYFRNSAMLVMDDPESGNTILEIERVLTDKEFREFKLSRSRNMVVKSFWKEIAEKAGGELALANMAPYITNKFDTFLTNEIMRPIVTQSHSAFNFRQVMDEQKILLINLSKGRLGDLNSNLIGLIMVGKLLMAAFSRIDLPEPERKDFYLYIDEFQNVTTKSIAVILSEARKYRLDLIIAHQFIGQLEEEIKKAVFGNVGSMAMFRVGAEDAQFLEKQTEPTFNASDLMNIENQNAYLKLLINGQPARPFNVRTMPFVNTENMELAESIRRLSSAKYGRPRELVEEEIINRYQSKTPKILE